MSGMARVLLADGYPVSGCDLKLWSITDRLAALGARVSQGHSPDHLEGVDLVVTTRAVPPETPELVEAARRGLPVLRRGELLGRLMAGRYGIAVAGTHGKTTTTSMVALLLEQAGLDPTILAGGELVNLGTNAKRGAGPHLVVEADEFDRTFLHLRPRLAVVTNIEPEHLDYFGDFAQEVEAFRGFLRLLPEDGVAVVCADDPLLRGLTGLAGPDAREEAPRLRPGDLAARHLETYGLEHPARWQAHDLRPNALGGTDFRVTRDGAPFGTFSLAVPGRHNVSNALAALAVGHILGLSPEGMRETLATFQGARRRFEVRAEVGGITVVDDYAHHPTEVRATLRAARERYPGRRIVALFQPHTYSRVRTLLPEFVRAFDDADVLLITAIYAAREQDTWGISGADLVAAVQHRDKQYVETLAQATAAAVQGLRPGDVFLTLGAGDVHEVAGLVAQRLKEDLTP
ncbi:MAG: UDP-N-acetylmuramate--L-alanine ligase [Chloroflexi bacterium]|nr:UDP-N-acetylmuramate--L-alanine ligase [Chloroflexota bacterium]